MIDVPRILRMVADAAEEFDVKVRERTRENRAEGVDSQSIVDALATLSASAAAVVLDTADRAKGRGKECCGPEDNCCAGDETTPASATVDVAAEVERAAGRMGLVNEDELAALRKRVVELEKALSAKPAKKAAPARKRS
jgi:hypothetical protein